ncbi:hypothetical protein NA57DRAFT_81687 [Rhizodiscina lignyota]|uniref:C2H2-type domain-containing protein n=1 Tax=Rhizodiscina lignyota TaxID=1504668 RepID=A0A9P4I122_9PEZI|nr:hypothetical protein NA57DRAFT_81687 [Rhizodiscina lignyota]
MDEVFRTSSPPRFSASGPAPVEKTSPNEEANPKPKNEPLYQCTFCHQNLTSKSWKRHEASIHLPQSQWVCQLNGGCVHSPSKSMDGSPIDSKHCVFCGILDPDNDHFESNHRSAECALKPVAERSFQRKDHLKQHCRLVHEGFVPNNQVLESWQVQADYSHHRWSCGFCGEKLEGWDERAKHIRKHFQAGLTMADWNSEKCLETDADGLFNEFTEYLE